MATEISERATEKKPDKKSDILLESGTNELEVMEFTVAGRHFGINVAKVTEIMRYSEVTPMPNANPVIEGIFKPRDEIVTVVDMAEYMGMPKPENHDREVFIITNFNKTSMAFHVHTVEAIHRISWTQIEKPDPAIYGSEDGLATGVANFDGRLITILDFEKILAEINPTIKAELKDVRKTGDRSGKRILVADDSPTLERILLEALEKAGYSDVMLCANGQEAWDKLQELKNNEGPVENYISCVVTDIEMPQMDGHRLIKLIRADEALKDIPVIVFSSLITPDMMDKGRQIGATLQFSKPEIANLISAVDQLFS